MEYSAKDQFFDLVKQANGGNLSAFCREYSIPLRTGQDWKAGKVTPAPWVLKLLKKAVDIDHPTS